MASGFTLPPLPRTDYGPREEQAFRRAMREAPGRVRHYDDFQDAKESNDEDDFEDDPRQRRMIQAQENARHSVMTTEAPRVPFQKFLDQLEWLSGEHFAMIGPTGQGKTTMMTSILPLHNFNVVFATKPRDDTMTRLIEQEGYLKIDRWRPLDAEYYPKRVLWPDATSLNSEDHQKGIFHEAFGRIFREGGWTVALDELWYIINILKLERDVKSYLLQARSLGISLVCATQRPAYVPLEVYDQSTHLMFWRDNDRTNLDRISGLASNNARLVRELVSNLDRYQVLYINTRTGRMLRTRVPFNG